MPQKFPTRHHGQRRRQPQRTRGPRREAAQGAAKDGKPRIRRVPVVIEQAEEEPAAPAATKRVQFTEQVVTQEPPEPPMKSPRTLHQEHVQALAAERRKLAQAKQAHYENLFDRNLSW